MPTRKSAFRNQRVRFQNYSPPYGDKATFDPSTPSEGTPPRGGVPSRKNGRVVSFWTPGEYAAIVLFEATPAVKAYQERPALLAFRAGARWYRYVPHFRVELDTGPVIVELSATGGPVTAKQELVAEMARAHYASRGIRFAELAHSAVRAKPRSTDALMLMRYLSVKIGVEEALKAADALAGGAATLASVEERSGVSRGRLLAMVRTGGLEIRGHGRIDGTTLLASPMRRGAQP